MSPTQAIQSCGESIAPGFVRKVGPQTVAHRPSGCKCNSQRIHDHKCVDLEYYHINRQLVGPKPSAENGDEIESPPLSCSHDSCRDGIFEKKRNRCKCFFVIEEPHFGNVMFWFFHESNFKIAKSRKYTIDVTILNPSTFMSTTTANKLGILILI